MTGFLLSTEICFVRSVKLGALDSRDKLGSFGVFGTVEINLVQLGFLGFCEMSCVKYCVYAYPSGYLMVQTQGASSAPGRNHAPTRNEEGSYIRSERSERSNEQPSLHRNILAYLIKQQFFVGWVGWLRSPNNPSHVKKIFVPLVILSSLHLT